MYKNITIGVFIFLFAKVYAQANESPLEFCRNFSQHFQVSDSDSLIPHPPILQKSDARNFERLFIKNRKKCLEYTCLIFLKVYKAQLECCTMGYNIVSKKIPIKYDILTYIFIKGTNYCNLRRNLSCDYISSAVVYSYVKGQKNIEPETSKLIDQIDILLHKLGADKAN